jgi:hypothetical protein
MVVTFTLQSQYSGATYVAGPFNISGTTSANVTTELATGVTKAQLLDGHTITGIADTTTGGTIASTGVCTTTQPWVAFASPTPTPTPTATSSVTAECWSLLYSTSNPPPSDLYVRYRDYNDSVQTTLISSLISMDNGDGTITAGLCVLTVGTYNVPVFVQGGIEQGGTTWLWSNDGTPCTGHSDCIIGN